MALKKGASPEEVARYYEAGVSELIPPTILERPTAAPLLRDCLSLVRFAIEDFHRADFELPEIVWCAPFERDTEDSLAAFAPAWGSSRDLHAGHAKTMCLAQYVERVLSEPEMERLLKAVNLVKESLELVVPVPDGTMYTAFSIAAYDVLDNALVFPQPHLAVSDELRGQVLEQFIATQTERDSRVPGRIAASFSGAQTQAVPDIGRAICAVAHHRGDELADTDCTRAATNATSLMLMDWVDSMTVEVE